MFAQEVNTIHGRLLMGKLHVEVGMIPGNTIAVASALVGSMNHGKAMGGW